MKQKKVTVTIRWGSETYTRHVEIAHYAKREEVAQNAKALSDTLLDFIATPTKAKP